MDTNKMRERFEEFMRRKPKALRAAYLRAFEAAWQGSRDDLVVALTTEPEALNPHDPYLKGWKEARQEDIAAIQGVGVRWEVRP